MKAMKTESEPEVKGTGTEPANTRGALARLRERLIAADLAEVKDPNPLLIRGIVGKATVAVGYVNPTLHELLVEREVKFSPLIPTEEPGVFRGWADLPVCPSADAGRNPAWALVANPNSLTVPKGIEFNPPPVEEAANLGSTEHPLHGVIRWLVPLPKEKWERKFRNNPEIRRVFTLNGWVPLTHQVNTNWLIALVQFVGGMPSDWDSEHDRLTLTVTFRPAAAGWMTQSDARLTSEAARVSKAGKVRAAVAATDLANMR